MERTYKAKIIDVAPNTVDEDRTGIIDAYIKVKIGDLDFWCFTYSQGGWTKDWWSSTRIGRCIPLTFIFLNIPKKDTTKSETREKKSMPVDPTVKTCDHYTIIGEVVDKEPFGENTERLYVDFGVVAKLGGSFEKDKFKVGDFIQARGRLDAYLVDEGEADKQDGKS